MFVAIFLREPLGYAAVFKERLEPICTDSKLICYKVIWTSETGT
jgi:hypothetical protein